MQKDSVAKRAVLFITSLVPSVAFVVALAPWSLQILSGPSAAAAKEDAGPDIEWAQDGPPAPTRMELAHAHRPLIAVTGDGEAVDPLRQAIRLGDADAMRRILDDDGLVDSPKRTLPPIFDAVLTDDPEILRLLLDAGADINRAWRFNARQVHTPLSYAVWHSKRNSLFVLLDAGADATRLVCPPKGPCGNALSLAALAGDAALLREMIGHDAIGDSVINMRGIYSQHAAVLSNGGRLPRLLPALHMAARAGHTEAARTLLALGADLDRLDVGNRRAEYHARFSKAKEIQQLFAAERTRAAQLVDAVQSGENGLVRRMLADGANPNLAMQRGPSPLIAAIGKGDREAVKILLDAGADPNRVLQESTPMLAAMIGRDVEIVRLLLAAGADPNEYRDGRMPPFADAVLGDDRALVQAFLDAGASLTTRYKVREARIHNILSYALSRDSKESAVLLARHGADPNLLTCNSDGICGNALTHAALSGDAALVENLIRAGRMPPSTVNMTYLVKTEHGLEAVVIRSGNETRPAFPQLQGETRMRDGDRMSDDRVLLSPLSAAKKAGHTLVIETLRTLGAMDTGPASGDIQVVN